jgi:hypothetical protein
MTDEELNGTGMVHEFLGKRQRLAYQTGYALSQRICNELITSVALLDNIAWVLLTLGENETNLLLGLPENELTIVEKSLQTSGSAHIA